MGVNTGGSVCDLTNVQLHADVQHILTWYLLIHQRLLTVPLEQRSRSQLGTAETSTKEFNTTTDMNKLQITIIVFQEAQRNR